jgi:hypothetical protein
MLGSKCKKVKGPWRTTELDHQAATYIMLRYIKLL